MNSPLTSLMMNQTQYRYLAGAVVWALGWLLMLFLDGHLDLSSLSMLLVLTSAVAAVFLPIIPGLLLITLALMAFNWAFVPPRGTFTIDFHQHALLLLAMLVVNTIVTALMIVLREHAQRAERHAFAADTLRSWGDKLRDAEQPQDCQGELQKLLAGLTNTHVCLMVLKEALPLDDQEDCVAITGSLDREQRAGLWYCLRNMQALGPDTGRYQVLADIYLPLRGRAMAYGAALIATPVPLEPEITAQAQALCDQMGAALERYSLQRQQQLAQQKAHEQSLRTTLLAAISHDYRTPLATIMGAASSLEQQVALLTHEQQQQLAHRIVSETERLRQITDNILQLARLDAPGLVLACDWESAEELIGSLLQRFNQHKQRQRLQVSVEPDLPLLWCDSLLISQLLDNLIDNAFKYTLPDTPIHISAQRKGEWIILAVRDQGPGIPESQQRIIFDAFQRVSTRHLATAFGGVGIGLALCRTIAATHGGELRLKSSAQGSCFECYLPVRLQPDLPEESVV